MQTSSVFSFKALAFSFLFMAVGMRAIAQSYQPVKYGYIAVRQFASHVTCGKPFEFHVYNSGDFPMNGIVTVTYDPGEFALLNAGAFTNSGPGILTKTVHTGTHQYGTYACMGLLALGASSANFAVNFTGTLGSGGTVNITNTANTPQIVTVGGGNISAYFQSAGGPLLNPGANGQTTAPQFVKATGNLVIDQNYVFATGSEIMFSGAGAGIEISNGSNLRLLSSLLYGCNQLWNRIWVRDGSLDASGNLAGGETIIQDAEKAVEVSTNGRFNAFWTRFRKNRFGLFITPNGGVRRTVDVTLGSTKFLGNGLLLDGSTPLVGASLNDAEIIDFPFSFGGSLVLYIEFDGLQYGLFSDNSVVTLTRVLFRNIPEVGIYAYNNSSVTYNGTLFFSPLSSCDGPALFYKIGTGVKCLQSDLMFQNGTMQDVGAGFRCEPMSIGDQTTIKKSCINALSYGIRIFAGNNTAGSISSNRIIVKGNQPSWPTIQKGYGIGLFDNGPDVSTDVWEIVGNSIDVEARSAIEAISFENAKIYANPKIKNTAARPAIVISGGFHNDVECNPDISGSYGVIYDESPYADISCNTISSSHIALQFYGDCSESKIRGNALTGGLMDLGYGADFFNYATTGKQTYHRNRFLGNAGSGFEAIHHHPDEDIVGESRYKVSTEGGGGCSFDADQMPLFSAADDKWFEDEPSIVSCAFSCPVAAQCAYVPGILNGDMTHKDEMVRDNLWGANTLAEGAQWNAHRYLYRKLKALPNAPLEYQAFMQGTALASAGKYADYDDQVQSALSVSTSILQAISQLRDQREVLTDSLSALQVWVWTNDQFVFDSGAEAQRQALLSSIRQLDTQLDGIANTAAQGVSGQLGNLKTMNDNAPTAQVFEANQQVVNAFHLNRMTFGPTYVPAPSELAAIDAVAAQCPMEGGKAVYQARAIMEAATGEVYDNQQLCGTGQALSNQISTMAGEAVTVSPNPASDLVQIDFHGQAPFAWSIFDVLGNRLALVSAESSLSILRFDVRKWPSGIYFLSLKDQEGKCSVRKILVSH